MARHGLDMQVYNFRERSSSWLTQSLSTVVLILLGAYETVFNRTKKTIRGLVRTCARFGTPAKDD